jgi:hypothetical protein
MDPLLLLSCSVSSKQKMPGNPISWNLATRLSLQSLEKTRGFPSPPCGGFGFSQIVKKLLLISQALSSFFLRVFILFSKISVE